jgi:hypothetical protein
MEEEQLVLESLVKENIIQRRKLLPIWIKIFIWIFIVFGALGVLGFIAGLFSVRFEASLYGLETDNPLSAVGLFICFLFVFKGIVSVDLWTEKDWAVDMGIADAILGIAVCVMVMIMSFANSDSHFAFRLELVLLIPFLIKLWNIRTTWKKA